MGTIYINQLRKTLGSAAQNRSLQNLAFQNAKQVFQKEKKQLLHDIDNHEVSKEISEGNTATHRLGILSKGNLFSILGFNEGDKPIENLKEIIDENISIDKSPIVSYKTSKINFKYTVSIIEYEKLKTMTPSPWSSAKSWVSEIENGISGYGRYIYKEYFKRNSRSLTGLEASNPVRSQSKTSAIFFVKELLHSFRSKFS